LAGVEGGGLDVGVVLGLLGEREVACRAECDRLRAEVERIDGLLSVCRSELERLVTARAVVGELAMAYPGRGSAVLAQVNGAGVSVSGTGLEVFTDRVLAVLAEQGRAVRCQEVVAALGQDASVARHVERVRHRLKKLAVAGRVQETAPGLFTLPRARGPAQG
jgi:hypothetical protein